MTKHGVKQVDRMLSNRGVDVWAFFAYWTPFIVGARTEVVVALDWTSFAADGSSPLAGSSFSPYFSGTYERTPGSASVGSARVGCT